MNKKSGRGFTLIELLVVIAIIGILASIVLASLNAARKKGRDASRLADMKQVQLALELYYEGGATKSYPLTNSWGGLRALIAPTYISTLPDDPINNASYLYTYQATNGAATPSACPGAGPCAGYLMRAATEVSSFMSTTVTGIGAVPTSACDKNPAGPPFDYCLKI